MGDELSSQQMSKINRYGYAPLISFLYLCWGCGGIAVGLAFVSSGVYFYINNMGDWLFPILVGALIARFMFSTLKFSFENTRPIVIDEMGISAWAFGRVWKSIAWPDVKGIERVRSLKFKEQGSRYGYSLLIIGSRNQINIEDDIHELPDLLSTLNAYAQRYQIPLLARDKGEDTRAKIKVTVKDKQERKKLLKEGVQSSITAL